MTLASQSWRASAPAAKKNAAGAGDLANLASIAADPASLAAEACDGRVAVPPDQPNAFAGALEQSEKAQQDAPGHRLQIIEGTSKERDAILQDVDLGPVSRRCNGDAGKRCP